MARRVFSGDAASRRRAFNLEADYTSISHYAVGLNNFLLFVNAVSGLFRVRRVQWNGLPGEVVQTDTWTMGWTTVRPFSTADGNFLFKLKAGNGREHVERIMGDGSIGAKFDDRPQFATGFKVVIPYTVAGGTFLFLLNPDTGKMVIRKVNQNGKIGDETDQREFNLGWETAEIFTVGLGKYVILIKRGP